MNERTPFTCASILVSVCTVSFGKDFLSSVLAKHEPARIVVFSRDELKQYELKQKWEDDDRVRFFLGDIRDRDRLTMAMRGVSRWI